MAQDPKQLMPGVQLSDGRKTVTIAKRKDDNTGWWLTDSDGGLIDYAISEHGWRVVGKVNLSRCRACGGHGVVRDHA